MAAASHQLLLETPLLTLLSSPILPQPSPDRHYRSLSSWPWTHNPSMSWSWILTLPRCLTPRDAYTHRNTHAHTRRSWLFPRPYGLSRRYLGLPSPPKASSSCGLNLRDTHPPLWLPGHVTYSPGCAAGSSQALILTRTPALAPVAAPQHGL